MRPLKEEFFVPLDLIERNWLRRLNLIIVLPYSFIFYLLIYLIKSIKEFFNDFWFEFICGFIIECWKNNNDE